jgi:hypothetical protein
VRKIFIQEPDSAIWKKWIRDCQAETKKTIDSVAREEKPIVNEKLYKRESIKKSYFITKSPPFYGRCAYCESPIVDTQYPQVEHFRPKAGIKDENGKVINFKDENGIDTGNPHLGYYWLAYDWRNLLPSCAICNQPKSTLFPVVGQHAQVPNEEANEKPLLINPISELEEDNPEHHLSVDAETGIMYAVDRSPRGAMCIKLFRLNERDQLVDERKKIRRITNTMFTELYEAIKKTGDPTYSDRQAYQEIIKCYEELISVFKGSQPYTAAYLSILRQKGFTIEWLQKRCKIFQDLLSKLDG